jgi:hypothetical protein
MPLGYKLFMSAPVADAANRAAGPQLRVHPAIKRHLENLSRLRRGFLSPFRLDHA